ncbi:lipase family protein [Acetobacter vaccinii]|uniref:Lipase n=1 Tax=Acetobacter vaccinii TaxID=2592655 RepID=A0A5C1YSM5_9PROT|nr:lipase family protein [Acetobacter vaccinii]QEO17967.1 lipase [Acetobacter vaccinii]
MKALFSRTTLLALTCVLSPLPGLAATPTQDVSAFYQWQAPVEAPPGTILRTEPLKASWLPADTGAAYRILYSSTDGMDPKRLVPVSGYMLFPSGPAPKKGWPVVIWAHGTTGVADRCAPSWMGPRARDTAYLNAWLKRGFAIVASDYQGLGTPGVHPYLLYRPEAYSLLDAGRAILNQKQFPVRNTLLIVGQSQGAGATLAASWAFPQYAPKLGIKAAVMTGLVASVHQDHPQSDDSNETRYTTVNDMDPAFAMLRLAGSDQAIHPQTDPSSLLSDKGRVMLSVSKTACLHDLFDKAEELGIHKGKDMLAQDITAYDKDMDQYFELPNGHVTIPLFLGTGLADGMAGTKGQYDAAKALCKAGTTVQWHTYPGVTHNGAVNYSLPDSAVFVKDVLSGKPVASSCDSLTPPGPIQSALPDIPFNK